MRVRSELKQVGLVARRYRSPRRWTQQVRAWYRLSLPPLTRRARAAGEVWGITVVRDEADILPLVLDHLFDQGIAHILVADNRSVDGTREYLLAREAADSRLHVALDAEPAHLQSEKMTVLAHQAWRAGADWVVPFDADEFWFAQGRSVAEHLRTQSTGQVWGAFHHMVPSAVTDRLAATTEFILDATPSRPGKSAARAHPLLEIHPGNHFVSRVGGVSRGLFIAHAQYRSPAQVARKVRQGAEAARRTGHDVTWFSPHWEAGRGLGDAEIAAVWSRISHGLPDERIKYAAAGPMVPVRPLGWRTWDPAGTIAAAVGEASA
ncbi:MAG: glycosyltransferase family 2 protein [Propioniciclava sp.]